MLFSFGTVQKHYFKHPGGGVSLRGGCHVLLKWCHALSAEVRAQVQTEGGGGGGGGAFGGLGETWEFPASRTVRLTGHR